MTALWVFGAGGHAKVVIDTTKAAGLLRLIGVLDDNPQRLGAEVLEVPVCGTIDIMTIDLLGVEYAVMAIGNNRARRARDEAGRQGQVGDHRSSIAVVAPSVRLGEGAVVFTGAVIRPDAWIGRHAIVNTAASIDHDCEIGDYAHIAPGVHLAGHVYVGEGAFVGIGSCAIPGCRIGEWVIIGAAARRGDEPHRLG